MQQKIILIGLILSNLFACISFGQSCPPETNINFEYAIYFSENSNISKENIIQYIQENYKDFQLIDSLPSSPFELKTMLNIIEVNNVPRDFVAPDMEYLKYCGRGMDEQQQKTLQSSKYVLVFNFFTAKAKLIPTMQKANRLMLELSKNRNDFIWDSMTRECFSREFWKGNRLIKGETINLSRHITMHLYPKGDYCRLITLGMQKFDLPDICIENLSCYSNMSLASLINLTAQAMHEEENLLVDWTLTPHIDSLKNQELKEMLINSLEENAQKTASLKFKEGKWEEGDPDNFIIEMEFSQKNPQVEQEALISTIFGSKDEISYISHNERILAASEKAKEKIPELYKKFNEGLSVGTTLLFKFPFENKEEQREWMWVEVIEWKNDQVVGLLQNDPQVVPHLKAGQKVIKDVNLMFDYILYFEDGTSEGNETGKIMMGQ